ncbi:MAG: hypothetical protein H0X33_02350 [Taibaiella sp.]|nr:hypothetical protein [Taibaiella sp.]
MSSIKEKLYIAKKKLTKDWFSFGRRISSPFVRLIFSFQPHNKIKLHLGSGNEYKEKWINVDNNYNVKADLHTDVLGIKKFIKKNSVSEILLSHVIGYFTLWQAKDFFNDIYNMLEDGGLLEIEFPDVKKCSQLLLDSKNEAEYIESIRRFYAFDTIQLKNREVHLPYKFGWSLDFIELQLVNIGFKVVEMSNSASHNRPHSDSRIIVKK